MKKFWIGVILAVVLFSIFSFVAVKSGNVEIAKDFIDLRNVTTYSGDTSDLTFSVIMPETFKKRIDFSYTEELYEKQRIFGCTKVSESIKFTEKYSHDYYINEFNVISDKDYIIEKKIFLTSDYTSYSTEHFYIDGYRVYLGYYEDINKVCNFSNAFFYTKGNGECRFTREEVYKFADAVKKGTKKYNIILCNKTHVLIADKTNVAGTIYKEETDG